MDLRTIMDTIIESERRDWHHIACWGAGSGPSYRDHFTFCNTFEGQKNVLSVESHSDVAIFVPDVAITMAWGISCNENYRSTWTEKFADRDASSSYVDVFYNNVLVYRDAYVSVDGARARLPVPHPGDLEVSEKRRKFFSLIDSMEHISQFDDYFSMAGFKVVDGDWLE